MIVSENYYPAAGVPGRVLPVLNAAGDALFELADAVLRGGEARFGRLRAALAGLPLPAWADGRIRLGIDVSPWLRPDAVTSPDRAFCHVHGRGRNAGQVIPGWPYSVVTALGPGASSPSQYFQPHQHFPMKFSQQG